MRQLFNCFKTWSRSRVEQMQRTQLIIFFLLRGEPYTVRLLLESFKILVR